MGFFSKLPTLTHALFPSWAQALLLFAVIVGVGVGVQDLGMRALARRAARYPFLLHTLQRTRILVRYMIALFAAGISVPLLRLPSRAEDVTRSVFLALFVVQMGWIVMAMANLAIDHYERGLRLDSADNLLARKAATQVRILRRACNILLVLLTVAFALMSFDSVREFGISLFASAGIAGIVAGVAARPMLENLLAGVQLAITQPLRLEDAVVIANEMGWVEEINSTYIVVRLWDWRRLVVPLSYLFQNPFTNWTRASSSLIGTVLIYADYTLPMDAVRAKAAEIARQSRLWDGNVINVQVSDARQDVMEVRVLASAADSSKAWDLRCEIREKLIAFIRDEFPHSLPRTRQEAYKPPENMAS